MTPIDPYNGIDDLYRVYEAEYERSVGRIPSGISPAQIKGNAIYAVARAVLPEGYIAVPVAVIEQLVTMWDASSGTHDGYRVGEHTVAVLRSLLPKEATNA